MEKEKKRNQNVCKLGGKKSSSDSNHNVQDNIEDLTKAI